MTAEERFPGLVELRQRVRSRDFPRDYSVDEQRHVVLELIATVFTLWDGRISELEPVLEPGPEPVCTCVYPPDYDADACKVHGSGVPRG
jgi:hypothetical protein